MGLIFLKFTGPFNAELVQALPSSLKYICHNGAGYDNIDVGACSEKGWSHISYARP